MTTTSDMIEISASDLDVLCDCGRLMAMQERNKAYAARNTYGALPIAEEEFRKHWDNAKLIDAAVDRAKMKLEAL
jgi:hypothetical protein